MKDEQIQIKVSETTKGIIQSLAKKYKMSLSEYMLVCALNPYFKENESELKE